jgi:hypothetical protein
MFRPKFTIPAAILSIGAFVTSFYTVIPEWPAMVGCIVMVVTVTLPFYHEEIMEKRFCFGRTCSCWAMALLQAIDTRHMLPPSQFVQRIIVNLVGALLWVVSGALMTISLWFPPVESDSVTRRTERDTKHSLPVHIIVDLNLPVGPETAATASDDDSSMITIELAEGDRNV